MNKFLLTECSELKSFHITSLQNAMAERFLLKNIYIFNISCKAPLNKRTYYVEAIERKSELSIKSLPPKTVQRYTETARVAYKCKIKEKKIISSKALPL